MGNELASILATSQAASVFPFILGILVVAMLIGAVWMGWRVRRQEPPRPRPDEQPHLPNSGPVREERGAREPNDIPWHKTDRLTPHQLEGHGRGNTRPSSDKNRHRWSEGNSGSFGSGSLGRR